MTYVRAKEAKPGQTGLIKIHEPEDFDGMRAAGRIAANALDMIAGWVAPGVTTDRLDRLCYEFVRDHGAVPAR